MMKRNSLIPSIHKRYLIAEHRIHFRHIIISPCRPILSHFRCQLRFNSSSRRNNTKSNIYIIPNHKVISDRSISKAAARALTNEYKSSHQSQLTTRKIPTASSTSTHKESTRALKSASQLIMKSIIVDEKDYKMTLVDFLVRESGVSGSTLSRESARFKIISGQVLVHPDAGYSTKTWNPKSVMEMGMIRTEPNFQVRPGQMISYLVGWKSPEEVIAEKTKSQSAEDYVPLRTLLKENNISILYEDADVLAISKPRGLPSHGGSKQTMSLAQILQRGSNDEKSYHLVHRLDKDTTGAMIIAKSPHVAAQLTRQFETGKGITKLYLAILVPKEASQNTFTQNPRTANTLDQFTETLNKRDSWVDLVSGIRQRGDGGPLEALDYYEQDEKHGLVQKAHTRAKLLFRTDNWSLVAFQLITGRKHQIRLQCQHHLNMIILGDQRYGKGTNDHLAYYISFSNSSLKGNKKARIPPLFLHSWYLHLDRNKGLQGTSSADVSEDEHVIYPVVRATALPPSHFSRMIQENGSQLDYKIPQPVELL